MRESVESIARLGPYELGSVLGSGAFATVRAAVHLPTNEKVAIKFIVKDLMNQDEYWKKNLYREVDIMKKLRHPNIIRLLEVYETDKFICLVTEHAMCDLLSHLCTQGLTSESDARRFARQLISAIEHMHSQGIVHRDLKAENLLLSDDMDVKIIDFGLSNDITGKKFLETGCGSLSYSAPELVGCKPYGKEVDIWSFGVCMFVILTGSLPFLGDRVTDLHAAMLDGGFKPPPEFSAPLQSLFTQVFQVKPNKRITLENLKLHEWIVGNDGFVFSAPMTPLPTAEEVQDDIVTHMVRTGFENVESIINSVTLNLCDRQSAAYYLLLQRKIHLSRPPRHRKSLEQKSKVSTSSLASVSRPDSASKKTSQHRSSFTSTAAETARPKPRTSSFGSESLMTADPSKSFDPSASRRSTITSMGASLTRNTSNSSNTFTPAPPKGKKVIRSNSGRRLSTSQLPAQEASGATNESDSPSSSHRESFSTSRRASLDAMDAIVLNFPLDTADSSTLTTTLRRTLSTTNPASQESRLSRSLSETKFELGSPSSSGESNFISLVSKVIQACNSHRTSSPSFRKSLALDCHSALLFTPDSTFYGILADNGWDGLEFTSQSFDPAFLAEDLQQMLGESWDEFSPEHQSSQKSPVASSSRVGMASPHKADWHKSSTKTPDFSGFSASSPKVGIHRASPPSPKLSRTSSYSKNSPLSTLATEKSKTALASFSSSSKLPSMNSDNNDLTFLLGSIEDSSAVPRRSSSFTSMQKPSRMSTGSLLPSIDARPPSATSGRHSLQLASQTAVEDPFETESKSTRRSATNSKIRI